MERYGAFWRQNPSYVKIWRMAARSTKKSPPVRPYHHGNLRESLLDGAELILAGGGADRLTLREVAKTAGVSHAAPYHHFSSLDELLAAVAQRGFVALAGAMTRASEHPQAREQLLGICQAYVDFARAHPARFRLMFGPLLARKGQFPGLKLEADRSFAVLLTAAMAYDPAGGALLAVTGWSLAHGLANLAIDQAFDGLPFALPDAHNLARQMAMLVLPIR